MKNIILVGGGGHALSVADSIKQNGEYKIVGYTDLKPIDCFELDYLGNDSVLKEYHDKGVCCAFICVGFLGESKVRDILYEKVVNIGYKVPIIIDKSAVLGENCIIGEGTFIGKRAVVNAGTEIGKMAIINTGAIVEHACKIGDYSHVAVGTVLCGEVSVGKHTLVGAGTVVKQCIKIGDDCIIGMGSTVLSNIKSHSKKVGLIK